MHVLVAAHDLYPDPSSGGTGRFVYETAQRLVDRGQRVSVITRRRGDVPRCETVAGIEVYRYELAVAEESITSILHRVPGARRRIREYVAASTGLESPDVVSFQGQVTSLLVDAAIPDDVPRVTTFHSPWSTEYAIRTGGDPDRSVLRQLLNGTLRWMLEARLVRRSDGVTTLSDFMRDELRRLYGPVADPSVVPGGVDAERYHPDAGVYEPMAGGGPSLLTVRRLSERMGHDRLLSAFRAVREAHPEARLYVAGDGPLRERLERTAERLGVADRTTFLGDVPEADLPAAYATADVFVLPTRRLEGFGLAPLEALASATPVVATNVGGSVEVLSGLRDRLPAPPLVSSNGTPSLADGALAWLGLDEAARERAGETCRRYVRDRYAWERTVSGLLAEYERHLPSVSERDRQRESSPARSHQA
jgi:glycosyltransferase involved in cell wall biosynthesis